ncbi:site-specific DNA-methyltransferase [Polaromonas sp. CG_9.11]|uniref:site-specific DNA-methyltransferase n=1 Tax=Polaromonas sp. CG_9.11 TaxID=2787730 RepID=UPI0018C94A36
MKKILSPLPDDSKHWDTTGNLLIKGDNLDALRLLRQSYFGKVKLIYIDPPYNTQSDAFIYRDDFSAKQSEVLAQLGYTADNIDYIKNIYGARTHSGWLSFMYPRLLLAKDLLRDDGVIFISIDDNEQAQLKLLCDEVFGQENFVCTLIWNKQHSQQQGLFKKYHEHVFLYGEDIEAHENISGGEGFIDAGAMKKVSKANPASDFSFPAGVRFGAPDGTEFSGTFGDAEKVTVIKGRLLAINGKTAEEVTLSAGWTQRKQMESFFAGEEVLDSKNQKVVEFYFSPTGKIKCLKERSKVTPPTILPPYGLVSEQSSYLMSLLGANVFDTPKPVQMIRDFADWLSGTDDICLDFFAGSGSTGEAVMRLNAEDGGKRQFILVQIPQPIDPKAQKEAHTFVTETLDKPDATIFEITAERLRRAGAKIEAEQTEKAKALALLPAQLEGFSPDTAASSAPAAHVDTGFRVFDLVDDPDTLILQKPLQQASQADVLALQASIATPQPAQLPRILYNLLLAEGLPLTTPIRTVMDEQLYVATNVAFVVRALPLDVLTDTLRALQQHAVPPAYLTVYAPWIADDNFMLGIKTMAETLGYSEDKLRLRG